MCVCLFDTAYTAESKATMTDYFRSCRFDSSDITIALKKKKKIGTSRTKEENIDLPPMNRVRFDSNASKWIKKKRNTPALFRSIANYLSLAIYMKKASHEPIREDTRVQMRILFCLRLWGDVITLDVFGHYFIYFMIFIEPLLTIHVSLSAINAVMCLELY